MNRNSPWILVVLPEKISGITLFKQTRYWILKPQTHTHTTHEYSRARWGHPQDCVRPIHTPG
ncbi:hypothetical protein, partial [Burkholderia multivorans]|uniref:hypothetical protein n=1 Tax=Burkholderia multivorans TaxID=87883 RepID=UPI001C658A94